MKNYYRRIMLCFRAKIKVRYTLLLCSFFVLTFYGIAKIHTILHQNVIRGTSDGVASDVIRHSLTARWHDSRELLNKVSITRHKFLVGAKTPPKWNGNIDGQYIINEDKWNEKDNNNNDNNKNLNAQTKDLVADQEEIEKNSEEEFEESWDENFETTDYIRDYELPKTTVSNYENRGNDLEDKNVQDSKQNTYYKKDFIDDNGRNIQVQSDNAYPGIRENQQNIPEKGDFLQNFGSNWKLNTRSDEDDGVRVENNDDYDIEEEEDNGEDDEGENEEEGEREYNDPEEYDGNQQQEDGHIISPKAATEDKMTNMKFNKTIFQPSDSKIKYYIFEHAESFTQSQINESRMVDGREEFPMTPEDAVRKYGDELPPWEKYEIFHYPKIYYLGLGANKTKIQQNVSNNFGFDFDTGTEKEGHYRVVVGDHIGYRYEILKYVDAGTFGAVVLARDWSNPTARDVALKIMHLDEEEKYFMREVRMMEHLEENAANHQYFSRMIATFQFRNHWCIVMELLGHAVDRHYLKQPIRDPHLLRQFSSDIINAMYYLNKLNVVHGDLKPDNIMYIYGKNNQSKGQLLKVADFGISCIPGSEDYHCPEYYIQTRYYRAPEVILSLPITPQCDMFSVGVILAGFYLGVPPFFGETEADQLAAMMEVIGLPPTYMIATAPRKKIYAKAICYTTENGFHRKPYRKPLTKVLKGMDPMLFDLIARCLEWDPKLRITPEKALRHPFFTGSYSAVGLPTPLLIKRLFGKA